MRDETLYHHGEESLLLKVLGRTPEIRILDFLLDNPLFDFTKKEILEAVGMTKRTLYKTLPGLEEMGLVKVSRKIGKAKLYKIDMENPVVLKLRELERELSLIELERQTIEEGEEIPAFEEQGRRDEIIVSSS